MGDHFNSGNLPYPSATDIGREFVRQYYTKWSFHLEDVYQFYGNESMLSYDGHEASGQENIQKTVNSLGYSNCKARIHSVNGLHGGNGNLTLQVCGELSFDGGTPRKFLQSFVLCKQSTKKYYVQTDIFQWVDKAFCADFVAKKPAVTAAVAPSESVHYAPQPPAAVEKPVVEASPIKSTIDHHTYVEPQQPIRQTQQQTIAKDIAMAVKPQHANGHDGADSAAAKQTTQPANGDTKPEPTRHSASNVSGVGAGGNTAADTNVKVHHQPSQHLPTKPQDNHPKSWAKAVSNNTSSGATPPQQPPQPVYNVDSAVDTNAKNEDEGAGAKRGHPRHYEKRNSGQFRGGHYNSGGGGQRNNNYRYQNRDGGAPREGYQNRDGGGPREGYQNRDGGAPREGYQNRDGGAPREGYQNRDGGAPREGYQNRDGGPRVGYQNRDSGPRVGYQNRDGGPRDGYQNRDGAPRDQNRDGAPRDQNRRCN